MLIKELYYPRMNEWVGIFIVFWPLGSSSSSSGCSKSSIKMLKGLQWIPGGGGNHRGTKN